MSKKPAKKAAKKKATKKTGELAKPNGKPFERGNPYAFQPGQSGNPNGRPKGVKYLSEAFRDCLSLPSETDPARTNADMVAAAVVKLAINGDLEAVALIADRTEGKALAKIEVKQDEDERDRKKWLYEKMVDRVIDRARDESGETLSRSEVIARIAFYQPEIREYVS